MRARGSLVALLLALPMANAACGDDEVSPDAGSSDSGPKSDASIADTGPRDSGDEGEALTVHDQDVSRYIHQAVLVSRVRLDRSGFVVVRADTMGSPGDELGRTTLVEGTSENIVVNLSRQTTDDEPLWAELRDSSDAAIEGARASFRVTHDLWMNDQDVSQAHDVVLIPRVIAPEVGLVVIREDMNGQPGAVIGTATVAQGENGNVEIELSRDAGDEEQLWAILHRDTGTLGTFEYDGTAGSQDQPVRDGNDNVVLTPFVTSHFLWMGDQDNSPTHDFVLIPRVISPVSAFVAIHEDLGGLPGAIIGTTSVPAGESTDVVVLLDRTTANDELLHAIAYTDTASIGRFEYDGTPNSPDQPLRDLQDNVIARSFIVTHFLWVADQDRSPDHRSVLVPRLISPVAGFLVVREDDRGQPGAVIGVREVDVGETPSFLVELDRTTSNGEVVHLFLHTDTGTVGSFDYDGSATSADPALLDGQDNPISATITLTHFLWMADQDNSPTHDYVRVPVVTSPVRGFVAVFEAPASGRPSVLLGVTPVPQGESLDVRINLNRTTANDELVVVQLHQDTNMMGTFEYDPTQDTSPDQPIRDGNDDPVDARVRLSHFLWVGDQDVSPSHNYVIVPRVIAPGPAFVAVHEDVAGGIGNVIGRASVSAGTTADLRIQLARLTADDEPLWLVLHGDTGQVGVWEFVDGSTTSPDQPLLDPQDNPIVGRIEVTHFIWVGNQDRSAQPNTVLVPRVISPASGFLVARTDNNGQPGTQLGFVALPAGQSSDVVITLSRNLMDDEYVWLVLHRDAGVMGTFEYDGTAMAPDQPVLDGNEYPVDGRIQVTQRVRAQNQSLSTTRGPVVVQRVISPGPGWITIRQNNAGSPGTVLGFAHVNQGTNNNVSVNLNRNVVLAETVFAVLHVDDGTIDTYEYNGTATSRDAPLIDGNDNLIAVRFTISFP
jgi:hypothetical protein